MIFSVVNKEVKMKKKEINKNTIVICIFCMIYFLVCLILEIRCWIHVDIPKELREGSMMAVAHEFALGKNPYLMPEDGSMPTFYMYGFLSPMITGELSRITGASVFIIATVCYALYKISACILIALGVYKKYKRSELAFLSACLLYTCFWRYVVYGGIFPDALGLCLSILLYYLMISSIENKKYHPILMALIVTLLFYTKVYFVFIFIGTALFLFMYKKKECIKFIIAGAILCIVTIPIINRLFPLYFTESVLFMSGSPGYNIIYSFKQLVALGKYFPVPILVIAGYLVYKAKLLVKEKVSYDSVISFPIIIFLSVLPVNIYFGGNDGTWLTYYLQLLMPTVILLFAEAYDYVMSDNKVLVKQFIKGKNKLQAVVSSIICLSILCPMLPYSISLYFKNSQVVEWSELYKEMDRIRESNDLDQLLVLGSDLSFYCTANDIDTLDDGECIYISQEVMDKWNLDYKLQRLFPYTKEIFDTFKDEIKTIREQIIGGEPDYIIIDDNTYEFDIDEGIFSAYELEKSYPIMVGSFDREVKIYKKKY